METSVKTWILKAPKLSNTKPLELGFWVEIFLIQNGLIFTSNGEVKLLKGLKPFWLSILEIMDTQSGYPNV